jgi:hypothetical protein
MGKKIIHMIYYLFSANKEKRPGFTLNKVTTKKYTNLGIVK